MSHLQISLKLFQQFLTKLWNDDRGFFQLALPAIMAGVGGLLNRGQNKQKQDSRIDETTTQNLDPAAIPLRDALLKAQLQGLESPLGLDVDMGTLDDIQLNETQRINRLNQGSQEAIASSLAGRGLSFAPGAASTAITAGELGRQGQIADLGQNIAREKLDLQLALPQIREQLMQSRLGGAGQFLQSLPTSTTTKGTRSGTFVGQGQSPLAGFASGALEGIAGALAKRNQQNSFANSTTTLPFPQVSNN